MRDDKAAIASWIERPRKGPTASIASTRFRDTIVAKSSADSMICGTVSGAISYSVRIVSRSGAFVAVCGEKSDALVDKIRHLGERGPYRRGKSRYVVVQNDDRCTVQRNSDIAANDGEIHASLFKGFCALGQIIDRKIKSNAITIVLQMPRDRGNEFCVDAIRRSDGNFKHLRPLGKAQQ